MLTLTPAPMICESTTHLYFLSNSSNRRGADEKEASTSNSLRSQALDILGNPQDDLLSEFHITEVSEELESGWFDCCSFCMCEHWRYIIASGPVDLNHFHR